MNMAENCYVYSVCHSRVKDKLWLRKVWLSVKQDENIKVGFGTAVENVAVLEVICVDLRCAESALESSLLMERFPAL